MAGVYYITLSSSPENLFDIFHNTLLSEKIFAAHQCQDIVGVAEGKQEALRLVSEMIMDMYERVVTTIRSPTGETNEFPITVRLHQRSTLSPYLFALVMDELTKNIQNDMPWCMLFADDIMLVDETRK